ncbi:AAA family ATPase [Desulfosporosinus metallidurans]|uniref:AAA-ATPase-like domain-containing protein n=1 Tax=Desulfosporosinus metallidurans TaxID=1888891 RepID=A0A1Q8R0F2_9FIRM|nr:AAA family ATPase [Desulfosporosinus metallidurans]OLN33109.1 hypothetical protein DSOL_0836 [Desulfosporosinus metallidurans]
MKKRIAIGVSDFREMLTGAYYYVDKTLFIKDILEDGSKVILLPRPRRFGKTLNMSMLNYFLEKSATDNSSLFENLAISQHSDCMDKQGQYPVIYLTFKDLKHNTWEVTYDSLVPEKIYHAFVLGLLVGLRPDYEIKSNREGGYGRYDVMVIPRDTSKAGLIIEFRSVDPEEVKDLEQIAQLALQQIEAKEYQQELFERGIHKIIKLGIVFRGKEVLVKAGH